MASETQKTTKCCHLSSISPAATQRLSLCKTDICPGALSVSLFILLFFLLSLFHFPYILHFIVFLRRTFPPGIRLQVLKVPAVIRNFGKMEMTSKSVFFFALFVMQSSDSWKDKLITTIIKRIPIYRKINEKWNWIYQKMGVQKWWWEVTSLVII